MAVIKAAHCPECLKDTISMKIQGQKILFICSSCKYEREIKAPSLLKAVEAFNNIVSKEKQLCLF